MSSQLPELLERFIIDGTKVRYWPDRIESQKRGERYSNMEVVL